MAVATPEPSPLRTRSQRWLASLALLVSNNPAVGLLRGRNATGLRVLAAEKIEITADTPQIPVGVDGESIMMSSPVTCTVSPGALRVWVPHDRPGIPAPRAHMDWAKLRHLAGFSPAAPIASAP